MGYFLHIECALFEGSVALSYSDNLLASLDLDTETSHATSLATKVLQLLDEQGVKTSQLSAVSVSLGPGSYTGLRIGVSFVKGFCFALNIPVIGIYTLDIMNEALRLENEEAFDYYIPLIDARRMEVYAAVYDRVSEMLVKPYSHILTEESFEEFSKRGTVLIGGSGATKFQEITTQKNISFSKFGSPRAKYMVDLCYRKWLQKEFMQLETFEPFYLKEFEAGKPSKKIAQILGL